MPFLNTEELPADEVSMEGFYLGSADNSINIGTDTFWIWDHIIDSKLFGLEGTLKIVSFQPLAGHLP